MSNRPLLIDLFCGAGGASVGYHRAGFEVIGVDIEPQPNYPFEFFQYDAIALLHLMLAGATWGWPFYAMEDVAAFHASPVCHDWSPLAAISGKDGSAGLLLATLKLLPQTRLPWIVENVVGAPLSDASDLFGRHGCRLCGSSFNLGVRRHRIFETSFPVDSAACCHSRQPEPIDVSGTGSRRLGPRTDGQGGNSRKPRNLAEAREAMDIDWMTRAELSQAIPPAYTEWIGRQLMGEPRNPSLEVPA